MKIRLRIPVALAAVACLFGLNAAAFLTGCAMVHASMKRLLGRSERAVVR